MELVTPQIGLIFWTTLSFFILLFILKKVAWTPILGAVKEREVSIKDALASAENARNEMANLQADNQRILKEARDIKATIVSEAKNAAKAEADAIISAAKVLIENEKVAAITELKSSVGSLSVDIA